MDNKTKSTLKLVAILIVLLMVTMELGWIIIPFLVPYKFWLMVVSFGLMLVAGK
ncbi:MAG: hypothetical protein JXQ96_17600 [Cyclobacteriaceae bacterium]